jgi:hypothetical protein
VERTGHQDARVECEGLAALWKPIQSAADWVLRSPDEEASRRFEMHFGRDPVPSVQP